MIALLIWLVGNRYQIWNGVKSLKCLVYRPSIPEGEFDDL